MDSGGDLKIHPTAYIIFGISPVLSKFCFNTLGESLVVQIYRKSVLQWKMYCDQTLFLKGLFPCPIKWRKKWTTKVSKIKIHIRTLLFSTQCSQNKYEYITVISLENWASLPSMKKTISAATGLGSMHQIFPILVVLYTYLSKLCTYRKWAD